MVVYWDIAVLFNMAIDYLLLLAAARLCGWPAARPRLLAAAFTGAAGAVALLVLPSASVFSALVPLVMCAIAYSGSGKALRLSALFFLSCCTLAGIVLLMGQLFGRMERLMYAVFAADFSFGVFSAASLTAYAFLCILFRASARRTREAYVTAAIRCGDKEVKLRLLRDTGNQLKDPKTGHGVPVIERAALSTLPLPSEREKLPYCVVGMTGGELEAFRCDGLRLGNYELGERLIALSPTPFKDCCGLWCAGEEDDIALSV